jgi:hypothetical protein
MMDGRKKAQEAQKKDIVILPIFLGTFALSRRRDGQMPFSPQALMDRR